MTFNLRPLKAFTVISAQHPYFNWQWGNYVYHWEARVKRPIVAMRFQWQRFMRGRRGTRRYRRMVLFWADPLGANL